MILEFGSTSFISRRLRKILLYQRPKPKADLVANRFFGKAVQSSSGEKSIRRTNEIGCGINESSVKVEEHKLGGHQHCFSRRRRHLTSTCETVCHFLAMILSGVSK